MLDCSNFYQLLRNTGVGFFTGVPDSLLKDFCAYLSDHASANEHMIAANEGGAVGLAAGHYLATGDPAMVYLQNSGQGNAVNPLLSLCDPEVYGIPMLLLVGWRGEPGVHDEPQHIKQGRVMNALFDAMEIDYEILQDNPDAAQEQVIRLLDLARGENKPVVLIVKKGTFDRYDRKSIESPENILSRETALGLVAELLPADAIVVSTTGHISRELYAYREKLGEGHGRDFMMVGSMGHASQVALGMALAQPDRPVFCFDGDGAVLMHLGGMPLIGQSGCRNLKHLVFNNGAHGSVGGQPTVALDVSLPDIARASGYLIIPTASSEEQLRDGAEHLIEATGPVFFEVRVGGDARPDLERPSTTPVENKRAFMGFVHGA